MVPSQRSKEGKRRKSQNYQITQALFVDNKVVGLEDLKESREIIIIGEFSKFA